MERVIKVDINNDIEDNGVLCQRNKRALKVLVMLWYVSQLLGHSWNLLRCLHAPNHERLGTSLGFESRGGARGWFGWAMDHLENPVQGTLPPCLAI
jgi:hypothetical protein